MKPSPGSRAALAILIALAAVLLGGCLHADTSVSLSEDDTASGELLISTETADGKVPFNLRPPEHLADRVQVAPHSEGSRVGSRLTFQDLEFDELEELSKALSPSESRYRLHLERTGSLVELSGSLDLTPLADTDSSVRIELTAPGEVTTTNGTESSGVVTWAPEPGEVTQLNATFQYAGSGAGAWTVWALVMGALALGAVLVITRLAQREHEHETAGTSA